MTTFGKVTNKVMGAGGADGSEAHMKETGTE